MTEIFYLKYPYPFVSMKDEEFFALWLQEIPCIKSTKIAANHQGIDLTIDGLDIHSFYELFGLATRYGLGQDSLAKLCNAENEGWMKNPKAPWYRAIFGADKLAPPPEIDDPGITAAAKTIYNGLVTNAMSGRKYEDLDIIGREEFDAAIQRGLLAADAARAAVNEKKS